MIISVKACLDVDFALRDLCRLKVSAPCESAGSRPATGHVRLPSAIQSMTSLDGLAVPPVLGSWSGWMPLRMAGQNRRIWAAPGLYRIRRVGDDRALAYIGQTGRLLRERLAQLRGVYRDEMPYRDPHTAAPTLWALRDRDQCDFEASVVEVHGTVPERKTLEV